MVYFLLDLFYFYNQATSFYDFLKPEPLPLRNPIIHKLFLNTQISNNINNSILRLFLSDVSLPSYYYLYENVTNIVTREFSYKDNRGNVLAILSPSSNGPFNPFSLTPTDINNIMTYLISPNINDMPSVISSFTGNKIFCKLYWFYRIYKSGSGFGNTFYNEFRTTISQTNSTNNLFIKLLEHIILKRLFVEVFNKNEIVQ